MLIDCPECTKPVSDTASACPNCGRALTAETIFKQRWKKKQDDKIATITMLVAAPIALGAGILFLVIFGEGPSSSAPSRVSPSYTSTYDASSDADLRALPSMRGFSKSEQDQIIKAAKGLTGAVNELEHQRGY